MGKWIYLMSVSNVSRKKNNGIVPCSKCVMFYVLMLFINDRSEIIHSQMIIVLAQAI